MLNDESGGASKRVFFPRPADSSNINAQAKNSQYILRHWTARQVRPVTLSFNDTDPAIAANPQVTIRRLRDDRLWRMSVYFEYMRPFDAVFCPGLHHLADWLALKTRALIGYPLPVIGTLEGLAAGFNDRQREGFLSEVAGHQVYCYRIPDAVWRRSDEMLRMSSRIIAISPFLARLAKALYGDKVDMVPLGVDVGLFRRVTFAPGPRLRVVGAGRVEPHKRPELFLDLAAKFPQADFAWFGDGEQRAKLIAESARRNLANLQFPGALPSSRLAEAFKRSDIFLFPSLSEGVPKVTQEAAAAGLAQIIFGFYEAPTVAHGDNGFVVWSDEELTERLDQLLGDRSLIEALGRKGMEMTKHWSWDLLAPQWERAIIGAL